MGRLKFVFICLSFIFLYFLLLLKGNTLFMCEGNSICIIGMSAVPRSVAHIIVSYKKRIIALKRSSGLLQALLAALDNCTLLCFVFQVLLFCLCFLKKKCQGYP